MIYRQTRRKVYQMKDIHEPRKKQNHVNSRMENETKTRHQHYDDRKRHPIQNLTPHRENAQEIKKKVRVVKN